MSNDVKSFSVSIAFPDGTLSGGELKLDRLPDNMGPIKTEFEEAVRTAWLRAVERFMAAEVVVAPNEVCDICGEPATAKIPIPVLDLPLGSEDEPAEETLSFCAVHAKDVMIEDGEGVG